MQSDTIAKIYEQLKNNLLYFFDKDNDYPVKFFQWVAELSTKNKIISENKRIKDREMVRRRRSEVYWIDFGVKLSSDQMDIIDKTVMLLCKPK